METNDFGINHADSAVLEAFKRNVRAELDLCNAAETPHICASLGGPDQFQRIDSVIISKVIAQRITIGEAIAQLENELNPNAYGQQE